MSNARMLALRAAFTVSSPIFAGFIFLGAAYGVMMTGLGFAPWMPVLMAAFICAGSMEFLTVSMLLAPFNPLGAALMTLMVNGRHVFYGLSLLRPYGEAGPKRIYMISALVDETYSILVTVPAPKGADEGWYMFYTTLFIQGYWVGGTALGAFGGHFLNFETEGIGFVMTALFICLFMSQWRTGRGLSRGRRAGLFGLVLPLLARVVIGPDNFMVPAMVLVLVALIALRPWIEKGAVIRESE